jgi:hypothetical protein
MNNNQEKVDIGEKTPKMTLKGYYASLSKRRSPRYEFISEVVKRCHVSEQTVRNWILYGIKPQQKQHVEVLCELTGIKEEDLWTD